MKNNNITNGSIALSTGSTNNVGTFPVWHDYSSINPADSDDVIVGKVSEINQYAKLNEVAYNTIKINFIKNKDEILMKCKEYNDIIYIIDQITKYTEYTEDNCYTILDTINAIHSNIRLATKYPRVINLFMETVVNLKNELIKEFRKLINKLKCNSTSDALNSLQESLYIQVDIEEFVNPIINVIDRFEENSEENGFDYENYTKEIACALSLLYRKTKFELYLSYLDKKYEYVSNEILDKLDTILSDITIDIPIENK